MKFTSLPCPFRSIGKRHSSWHMQRWSEIDTSELTLETSQQLALLSTLPETVVEGWDLFRMTVEAVHVVQTSAPLMDGLRRYLNIVQCLTCMQVHVQLYVLLTICLHCIHKCTCTM